jgi:hypothetical protein
MMILIRENSLYLCLFVFYHYGTRMTRILRMTTKKIYQLATLFKH